MRKPSDTDFFVDVPGIGRLRYGRRNFGDRIRIRSEFLRLTAGHGEDDLDLSLMAIVVAQHLVLCVTAPAGWTDIEAIDQMADPDSFDKQVVAIFDAVKEKEDSFRSRPGAVGEGAGPADGSNPGAVVPSPVSPGVQ